MKKHIISAVAVSLIAVPAYAGNNSATTSGSAAAVIVGPISIAHTVGKTLNFGAFAAAAGTITVNADGTHSSSGVSLLSGTATTADAFSVGGDAGRVFDITTTGGTVKFGATTMPFTTASSTTSATLTGGAASFTVGGTLTVAGTEGAGAYTGTYSATATYE